MIYKKELTTSRVTISNICLYVQLLVKALLYYHMYSQVLLSFENDWLGSIESLPVEFEGGEYTLQEIAQIGRKGPQLLVVNLSAFPQAMKNVLKAINDSGMGLNPQQDGTTIFISIPK